LNVFLIHCDQLRFDALSVNGHPLVRTPNLDRLAAEGTNFTQAYTPQPVCSPARACLLTGAWASTHGCIAIPGIESYKAADPALPMWPGLLKDAGYQLRMVGKYHGEAAGGPTDLGFDEYVSERQYGPWRAAQGLPPRPPVDDPTVHRWLGQVDEGVTPEQSRLAWSADHVERMIREMASDISVGGGASGGWVMRWDPSEPHLPCVVPEPFASRVDVGAIEPWPSFGDPLEGKPVIQAQQRRAWEVDGWTWDRFAPVVQRYLGEIELLDAMVGRLLDTLDELGVADQTLVIFSTDHGDFCGGRGMLDKHYAMYDELMRVPLIVRGPSVPAGETCDAFVSHELDIARTLLEAAGVAVPESFVGQSLKQLATDTHPDPRPDIFAQYHGAQFGLYTSRMVRDRRWKYIWNATAVDELYDLEQDPAEWHNRARDPAAVEELARMKRRMLAWLEQVGDPMLNMWTRGHFAPRK
jgi:arylsulfatase A-like enzyme